MPSEQGDGKSYNLPMESLNPRFSTDGTEVLSAQALPTPAVWYQAGWRKLPLGEGPQVHEGETSETLMSWQEQVQDCHPRGGEPCRGVGGSARLCHPFVNISTLLLISNFRMRRNVLYKSSLCMPEFCRVI